MQASLFEATFLNVVVEEMDIALTADAAALQLVLRHGLRLASNNIAGIKYRKVTSIDVPDIEARALLANHKNDLWIETGRFSTGVALDRYSAPKGWIEDADEQENFLQEQDASTRRIASIIGTVGDTGEYTSGDVQSN